MNIGADARSAAMDIVSNKNMLETKAQVLESYNELKNRHNKIDKKSAKAKESKKESESDPDSDKE